jgi:hypothetical protein
MVSPNEKIVMSDQATIIVLSILVAFLACSLCWGAYYHYQFKNKYRPRYISSNLEESLLPDDSL